MRQNPTTQASSITCGGVSASVSRAMTACGTSEGSLVAARAKAKQAASTGSSGSNPGSSSARTSASDQPQPSPSPSTLDFRVLALWATQ